MAKNQPPGKAAAMLPNLPPCYWTALALAVLALAALFWAASGEDG